MSSRNLQAELAERIGENMSRHQRARYGSNREHAQILVELIDPNPFQPRTHFPQEEIDTLAASIEDQGLLQPIVVRKCESRYQIVHGERRWRAHKLLGRTSIEALITHLTDEEMAAQGLIENLVREDLTDFEVGNAIIKLVENFPSKTALARALGTNREDLYRYLSFGDLPEWAHERLHANPTLLSRGNCAIVTRALADAGLGKAKSAELLRQILDALENGSLAAVRVGEFIQSALSPKAPSKAHAPIQLARNGKSFGSYARAGGNLVIKLKTKALSEDEQARVIAFVEALGQESPA